MHVELHDFHPSLEPIAPSQLGTVKWVVVQAWHEGRLLCIFHIKRETPRWETVTGGIEPGETPEEAARRELMEEAGQEAGVLVCLGTLRIRFGPEGKFSEPAALFTTQLASVGPFEPNREVSEIRFADLSGGYPEWLTFFGRQLVALERQARVDAP